MYSRQHEIDVGCRERREGTADVEVACSTDESAPAEPRPPIAYRTAPTGAIICPVRAVLSAVVGYRREGPELGVRADWRAFHVAADATARRNAQHVRALRRRRHCGVRCGGAMRAVLAAANAPSEPSPLIGARSTLPVDVPPVTSPPMDVQAVADQLGGVSAASLNQSRIDGGERTERSVRLDLAPLDAGELRAIAPHATDGVDGVANDHARMAATRGGEATRRAVLRKSPREPSALIRRALDAVRCAAAFRRRR